MAHGWPQRPSGILAPTTHCNHGSVHCYALTLLIGRTLSIPYPSGDARSPGGQGSGGDGYDLGGQWVGPQQPRALELIKEFGLELVRQPWFEDDDGEDENAGDPPAMQQGAGTEDGPALDAASSSNAPRSLSSGSTAAAEKDAIELACLISQLDEMASSVEDLGDLRSCPESGEWDALSVMDWLQANVRGEWVMKEMVSG